MTQDKPALERLVENLKKWRIDYEDLPEILAAYTRWYCEQHAMTVTPVTSDAEEWLKSVSVWPGSGCMDCGNKEPLEWFNEGMRCQSCIKALTK